MRRGYTGQAHSSTVPTNELTMSCTPAGHLPHRVAGEAEVPQGASSGLIRDCTLRLSRPTRVLAPLRQVGRSTQCQEGLRARGKQEVDNYEVRPEQHKDRKSCSTSTTPHTSDEPTDSSLRGHLDAHKRPQTHLNQQTRSFLCSTSTPAVLPITHCHTAPGTLAHGPSHLRGFVSQLW